MEPLKHLLIQLSLNQWVISGASKFNQNSSSTWSLSNRYVAAQTFAKTNPYIIRHPETASPYEVCSLIYFLHCWLANLYKVYIFCLNKSAREAGGCCYRGQTQAVPAKVQFHPVSQRPGFPVGLHASIKRWHWSASAFLSACLAGNSLPKAIHPAKRLKRRSASKPISLEAKPFPREHPKPTHLVSVCACVWNEWKIEQMEQTTHMQPCWYVIKLREAFFFSHSSHPKTFQTSQNRSPLRATISCETWRRKKNYYP